MTVTAALVKDLRTKTGVGYDGLQESTCRSRW